jgi:hypothetical protein
MALGGVDAEQCVTNTPVFVIIALRDVRSFREDFTIICFLCLLRRLLLDDRRERFNDLLPRIAPAW